MLDFNLRMGFFFIPRTYKFLSLYKPTPDMEEMIISNPEFNRMSSSLLELESCILLSDCELDSLVYEFYYLN